MTMRIGSRSFVKLFSGIPVYATFDPSTEITEGVTQPGTTAIYYTRITANFVMLRYFLVKQIKLNIADADTYSFAFVDGGGTSPNILMNCGSIVSAGGGVEETINIIPNIILTAGTGYYFTETCTLSTINWSYNTAATLMTTNKLLYMNNGYFNGVVKTDMVGLRLVGHYVTFDGLYQYKTPNYL